MNKKLFKYYEDNIFNVEYDNFYPFIMMFVLNFFVFFDSYLFLTKEFFGVTIMSLTIFLSHLIMFLMNFKSLNLSYVIIFTNIIAFIIITYFNNDWVFVVMFVISFILNVVVHNKVCISSNSVTYSKNYHYIMIKYKMNPNQFYNVYTTQVLLNKLSKREIIDIMESTEIVKLNSLYKLTMQGISDADKDYISFENEFRIKFTKQFTLKANEIVKNKIKERPTLDKETKLGFAMKELNKL